MSIIGPGGMSEYEDALKKAQLRREQLEALEKEIVSRLEEDVAEIKNFLKQCDSLEENFTKSFQVQQAIETEFDGQAREALLLRFQAHYRYLFTAANEINQTKASVQLYKGWFGFW
ncbi:hypothetical protein P6709_10095 [Jeotgalibacillus sp. ET6]|uniref:hypothetical protein n=1 Tax=Jeotgalibacillus sp. ET6 TaxID=3037260 RepID=UPI00241830E8|nr:hypothetical protein [Jeotgalibacillus sp. ET6]MDG5472103.1 hypothetical protein [Jeotgalibacillus sp. ET6]